MAHLGLALERAGEGQPHRGLARLQHAPQHALQRRGRRAQHLARGVASLGAFDLWNDGSDIPVFAWRLRPGHTENWTLHHLSDRLRMKGWLVPAYPLPDALSDRTVQRIVVRDGLSGDLADRLLDDIATETAYLDELVSPLPVARQHPSFHH